MNNEQLIMKIAQTVGPVFPAIGKQPLHKNWQEQATTRPDEKMDFSLGVAVKTGLHEGRNLIVFDTDTEVAEGFLRKNLTEEELETYTVKTKRGKHFYYFADPVDEYRSSTNFIVHGLDVRANGGLVISPPSLCYSVLVDMPVAPLPEYLKGLLGLHVKKNHGYSPESLEEFVISPVSVLWEFLRNIDPNLDRSSWIKVLAIARHYYEDSYETAMYWSALSRNKFPGERKFENTWKSLGSYVEATPATLIHLAREYEWPRGTLPIIPYEKLNIAWELSEKLFASCKELLERENSLTPEEDEALLLSAEVLIFSLFTEEKERIAIPLPTGFGKSTLIRSLIKLIMDEGLSKKLLICVFKHDEILESKSALEELGVSGETVGIYMSADYSSDWDCPLEELKYKKAVYISHNRIYGARDYEEIKYLSEADGEKRLVLWDESAQTTKGSAMSADVIEEQVVGLKKRMDRAAHTFTEEEKQFYEWLDELANRLNSKKYGEYFIAKIVTPNGFPFSIGKDLKNLIVNSGCYVALTKKGDNEALFIEMQVRIPDELCAVIFDASSVTRELIGFDKSIRHLPTSIARDYSACQIDCVNIGSSKYHLDNKDNLEVQIEILKEWIDELGISGSDLLVITQKPRYAKGNRGEEYPVDIRARLQQEIPGVNVITWGSERGINEYKHIKYTANIGMKWRDRGDLHADIQAQKRDLGARVDYSEIDSVQKSEFLSEVQQWVPRTNMRVSIDGKALETRILFMHSEATPLAERLERSVFPGIKINIYGHNVKTVEQERESYVVKINEYFRASNKGKISTIKLKKALGMGGLSKDKWNGISRRVEESIWPKWEKADRTWINI